MHAGPQDHQAAAHRRCRRSATPAFPSLIRAADPVPDQRPPPRLPYRAGTALQGPFPFRPSARSPGNPALRDHRPVARSGSCPHRWAHAGRLPPAHYSAGAEAAAAALHARAYRNMPDPSSRECLQCGDQLLHREFVGDNRAADPPQQHQAQLPAQHLLVHRHQFQELLSSHAGWRHERKPCLA